MLVLKAFNFIVQYVRKKQKWYTPAMSKALSIWILIVILASAVGLRSYQLTERSIWFDEAFSWRLTTVSFSEMIERTSHDVHPPLYYLVLKTWTIVFGGSVLALRSFSLVAAVISIVLAYMVGSYGFRNESAGLLNAALMALSGWQIALSQEARMYMFAILLGLLSVWLLLHAIRSSPQKIGWWILYGISVATLAYTHYYAFFTIAAQGIWLLGYVVALTRGRLGEILQWRLFWYAVLGYALSALFFLPWLKIFLAQQSQVQQSFWIPAIDRWSVSDSIYRMLRSVLYGPSHETWLHVMLALIPIALILLIWVWLVLRSTTYTRHTGDMAWLMMCAVAIPFMLSVIISTLTQSVYQDRYFALTHVFLLLSIAIFIMYVKPVWVRGILIVGVLGFFSFATVRYAQQLNIPAKPGVRVATDTLVQQRGDNEPIIVSSPFIFFSVDHYLTERFNLPMQAKLFSETGELAHFAGGPILNQVDIVKPDIFQGQEKSLWIVETTGFGGSELPVPLEWQRSSRQTFPEVFGYQGDIILNHYLRK